MFELHLNDLHCKRIIFGGSADNGYARVLAPHRGDAAVRSRLTLLEGQPFAKELKPLTTSFIPTNFPGVFRTEKLSSNTTEKSPKLREATFAAVAGASSAEGSAAGTGRRKESPDSAGGTEPVKIDEKGQRVDPPLARPSSETSALIRATKYCNYHHLKGGCSYPAESCEHTHGERLTGLRYDALRWVVRLNLCRAGGACRDAKCVFSHH